MRGIRVALALILCGLALAKLFMSSDATPPTSGALALFTQPWARTVSSLAELGVGLVLLVSQDRRLARVVACVLGAAVLLHMVDVADRGTGASGCGCFANPGVSSAGLDLARSSLLFGLFCLGCMAEGGNSRLGHGVFAIMVALLVASLVLPPPSIGLESRGDHPKPLEVSESVEHTKGFERAPSLRAVAGSPRVEPTAPRDARERALLVLVTDERKRPVEGAGVRVVELSPSNEPRRLPAQDTDKEGRVSFFLGDLQLPLGVIAIGGPPLRPGWAEVHELESDRIRIQLQAGTSLEVEVRDLEGAPLSDVEVAIAPAGQTARKAVAIATVGSRWALMDARRIKTSPLGLATVHGLDSDQFYQAHVIGHGFPMGGKHAAQVTGARPGPGARITLHVAPMRYAWARPVDSKDRRIIGEARWRFTLPEQGDGFPEGYGRLVWATFGAFTSAPPEHVLDRQHGDYIKALVVGMPGAGRTLFGPLLVEAPGYESRRVILEARTSSDAKAGPEEIALDPIPSADLGAVSLTLRSDAEDTYLSVQLREGKKIVFLDILGVGRSKTFTCMLTRGEYVATVSGNEVATIQLESTARVGKTVDLDELPSLVLSVRERGTEYAGAAGVMMRQNIDTPGPWNCGFPDVTFKNGRSSRFIVPAGPLLVAVSLPDGRHAMGLVTAEWGRRLEAVLEIE